MKKLIYTTVAVVAVLGLSGCSLFDSTPQTTFVKPDMVTYNEQFRMDFASELDEICGHPEAGIVDPYPRACTFIRDSLELRRELRGN